MLLCFGEKHNDTVVYRKPELINLNLLSLVKFRDIEKFDDETGKDVIITFIEFHFKSLNLLYITEVGRDLENYPLLSDLITNLMEDKAVLYVNDLYNCPISTATQQPYRGSKK